MSNELKPCAWMIETLYQGKWGTCQVYQVEPHAATVEQWHAVENGRPVRVVPLYRAEDTQPVEQVSNSERISWACAHGVGTQPCPTCTNISSLAVAEPDATTETEVMQSDEAGIRPEPTSPVTTPASASVGAGEPDASDEGDELSWLPTPRREIRSIVSKPDAIDENALDLLEAVIDMAIMYGGTEAESEREAEYEERLEVARERLEDYIDAHVARLREQQGPTVQEVERMIYEARTETMDGMGEDVVHARLNAFRRKLYAHVDASRSAVSTSTNVSEKLNG